MMVNMNTELLKKEILGTYFDENSSQEIIDRKFEILNAPVTPLYQFILTYSWYLAQRRDYGSGDFVTMLESHILTDIADNEGITITELSNIWNKSASSISQIVKKLLDNGFVVRKNNEHNRKIYHLSITKKGDSLVKAHKKYDIIDIIKTHKILLRDVSVEDIESFYKVIDVYRKLLEEIK